MRNKGNYLYEGDVLDLFLKASQTLNDSIIHTLGADGLNTAVPTSNGFLSIINDGKSIIENITTEDKALNLALNTLKESSLATNMNAGDGTTTTIVLQHRLLENLGGNKEFRKTKNLYYVRDTLLERLKEEKREIKSSEDLKKVIKVSLGADTFVDTVLKAFESIKEGQKPSLVKTKDTTKTEVVTVDGVSLTPVEINPVVLSHTQASVDEEIEIVILNQTVSRLDSKFTGILNHIHKTGKKTILVYTDIMPSVLDQMLFNIQEGALNLIPVRLACNPDNVDKIVEELGKYFNCIPFTPLHSYLQQDLSTSIGKGTGYILNKDSIVIKNENEIYKSDILPAKSSYISVGFITFSQQEEDYRRIEDAIHSAYNALTYGYVIGGGLTLKNIASELDICAFLTDEAQNAVKDVLYSIYNIIKNTLINRDIMNVERHLEENIFDSYKVAEQVILNAFTVVAQVLTTEKILINN